MPQRKKLWYNRKVKFIAEARKEVPMTLDELFRAFLKAYAVYYNVKETPGKESPFDGEAVFSSCEEQYFLLKGITLSETRIAEFVRFAVREHLTLNELEALDALAWSEGLAAAEPGDGHKCSDVTLIILAETIDDNAKKHVKNCRHDKTYRLGLWGFSHYRLAVIERSTGTFFFNSQGAHLKPLITDIWNAAEKPVDHKRSAERKEESE